MEYINQRNIAITAVLIVVIALGGYAYVTNSSQENGKSIGAETETAEGEVATSTMAQESDDTGSAETTSQTTTAAQETQVTTKPAKLEKKDLGPRQKAESPGDALRLFAEAMVANDFERAASYFSPEFQAQFQAEFEAKGKPGAQHLVVYAYYNGKVDSVELIDPQNGIYEIAVYPPASPFPFRTNYTYNAEVQEFVMTEF